MKHTDIDSEFTAGLAMSTDADVRVWKWDPTAGGN